MHVNLDVSFINMAQGLQLARARSSLSHQALGLHYTLVIVINIRVNVLNRQLSSNLHDWLGFMPECGPCQHAKQSSPFEAMRHE